MGGYRALRRQVQDVLRAPGVEAQVSPGFYFQRCLAIWQDEGLSERKRQDKLAALRPLTGSPGGGSVGGDPALPRALAARQGRTWYSLVRTGQAVELRIRNLTPLVTGIGQPHPLETGFAFLKPYGVPYVAGSGIKGAVRSACLATWQAEGRGDAVQLLRHYFGSDRKQERPGGDNERRRGALVFLDLLPDVTSWQGAFRVDVVNPHYGPYYQRQDVPADWHSPVPSFFLTLQASLDWRLRLLYVPLDLPREVWWEEVRPGIRAALADEGLGAKKSWGYGLFEILEERSSPDLAPPDGGTTPEAPTGRTPAGPGRPLPGPGLRVRQALDFVESLRPREVPGSLSRLERDLEGASAEERAIVADRLAERLRQFGWRPQRIEAVLDRIRGVPPGGPEGVP